MRMLIAVVAMCSFTFQDERKEDTQKELKVITSTCGGINIFGPLQSYEPVQEKPWIEKLKSSDQKDQEEAREKLLTELPSLIGELKKLDSEQADLVEEIKKLMTKFSRIKLLKDSRSGKVEAIEKLMGMKDEDLKDGTTESKEILKERDKVVERIKKLIEELGHDEPDVRMKAQEELLKTGMIVKEYVKKAINDKDPERAARAQAIVGEIERREEARLQEEQRKKELSIIYTTGSSVFWSSELLVICSLCGQASSGGVHMCRSLRKKFK